jgi:Lon protease-like protein
LSHNSTMQQGLLPLFPLPLVLFPRTALRLHIFEDRYKELIGEVLADRSEFGIVLAKEKSIAGTGCTAVVEKVLERYPDGRLDILTAGRRRFEILLLNDEKSYLRASVEFFDDDEPAAELPADVRKRALDVYQALRALDDSAPEAQLQDPQPSFQFSQLVEDLEFRQRLLRLRSESERLRELVEFCGGYIPRQRLITALKRVQPLNGHSRFRFPDRA